MECCRNIYTQYNTAMDSEDVCGFLFNFLFLVKISRHFFIVKMRGNSSRWSESTITSDSERTNLSNDLEPILGIRDAG